MCFILHFFKGGIKRNSNGKIESASATEIKFHGMVDQDNIGNNENELFTKRIFAEGPPADVSTLEFENALIEMLHRMSKKLPSEDIKMYFKTERSFNDEASQAVESDIIRFIIGLIVVYLFVLIMIGGFGWVQQRVNILKLYIFVKYRQHIIIHLFSPF